MSETDYEKSNNAYLLRLVEEVPELNAVLTRHLELHYELLSHLFMADIARWAESVANAIDGEPDALSKTLGLLDVGWIEGGWGVHEMIADPFLENLAMSGRLWDLLPNDLREAAGRIHDSQPDWGRLADSTPLRDPNADEAERHP